MTHMDSKEQLESLRGIDVLRKKYKELKKPEAFYKEKVTQALRNGLSLFAGLTTRAALTNPAGFNYKTVLINMAVSYVYSVIKKPANKQELLDQYKYLIHYNNKFQQILGHINDTINKMKVSEIFYYLSISCDDMSAHMAVSSLSALAASLTGEAVTLGMRMLPKSVFFKAMNHEQRKRQKEIKKQRRIEDTQKQLEEMADILKEMKKLNI